jgi:hypothetical protein
MKHYHRGRLLLLAASLVLAPAAARAQADRGAAPAGDAVNVEDYRLPSDRPGDDTGPIQRACAAVMDNLGAIRFAAKTYNVTGLTSGVEGQHKVCSYLGAGFNGDITHQTSGGTTLRLIAGSNTHLLTVPTGAPPMVIENVYFNGNKAQQSGTSYCVYMPDDVTDKLKQRSVLMRNVWLAGCKSAGLYAGALRNAGVLDHVTIFGGEKAAAILASNNDWRFLNSDLGSTSTGPALYLTGAGSFTSVGTNYFASLIGVRIDGSALDASFIGGSIDTNRQDGVVLIGSKLQSDTAVYTRTFMGVRFNQNGLSANNTYSDFKLVGEKGAVIMGAQFIRGTVAGTGGNLPRYHINIDAASSNVQWLGNSIPESPRSYVTAITNDPTKLIGSITDFNVNAGLNVTGGPIRLGQKLLISNAPPVIASGFGVSPSVVNSNGTAAFVVDVGRGNPESRGTITLPEAVNGWACSASNLKTTSAAVFMTKQVATTRTSASFANYSSAGTEGAWNAGDILSINCQGY